MRICAHSIAIFSSPLTNCVYPMTSNFIFNLYPLVDHISSVSRSFSTQFQILAKKPVCPIKLKLHEYLSPQHPYLSIFPSLITFINQHQFLCSPQCIASAQLNHNTTSRYNFILHADAKKQKNCERPKPVIHRSTDEFFL